MLGELSEQEVVEILENNIIGRIGCNDGEITYIVPVSYLIRDGYVLCHSRLGLKIEIMRKNPAVCFEVDEIRDYDNWRCVIAWGNYVELRNEDELNEARQYFSDYMLTMKTSKTSEPPAEQEGRAHTDHDISFGTPIFYKIEFTKITGRFERSL